MKESANRGIAMILLSAVIVGLLPNSAKIAYQEGVNPLAVITIRCVIGMIGLGIYMLVRKKPLQINALTTKASAVTGAAHALTALGCDLNRSTQHRH